MPKKRGNVENTNNGENTAVREFDLDRNVGTLNYNSNKMRNGKRHDIIINTVIWYNAI